MANVITDVCPKCGGEGLLFEQLDVDYFKPYSRCDECDGAEVVPVRCEECGGTFTPIEWQEGDHLGEYHYHKFCLGD